MIGWYQFFLGNGDTKRYKLFMSEVVNSKQLIFSVTEVQLTAVNCLKVCKTVKFWVHLNLHWCILEGGNSTLVIEIKYYYGCRLSSKYWYIDWIW